MSTIRRAWRRARDQGLDSIALLICGSFVAVLGVIGVASLELTISLTLGMLSAVAALLLKGDSRGERFDEVARNLVKQLDQVEKSLAGSGDASRALMFEYPDFTELLERSAEVDVVAGLALNIVTQYHGKWRQALVHGAKVNIICPEPGDVGVISHSLFRSVFRRVPDDVSGDIRAQLQFAKTLRESSDSLRLGTVPYLPPFGMVRFAGPGVEDVIFIKLMAFRVGAGQFPVLKVASDASVEWYTFFSGQIQSYLDHSTEVD